MFTLANTLGVSTATGIEIPLGRDGKSGEEPIINGIPEVLQDRLENVYGIDPYSRETTEALFRGMYQWLLYNNIPVDYFWLWTTEIWMPWGSASLDSVRIATAKTTVQAAVDVFNRMDPKPHPMRRVALSVGSLDPQRERQNPAENDHQEPYDNGGYSFTSFVAHFSHSYCPIPRQSSPTDGQPRRHRLPERGFGA